MNDPAEAVRELLTTPGTLSYDMNVGQFPTTPDKAILINATGGRAPYPHLALNFPSVQVMVRGKPSGYTEARTEIGKICDILLGMGNITANGDMYRSCNQVGDVIYLGQDDRGRAIFAANFWFIVEPSSLGNRVAIT